MSNKIVVPDFRGFLFSQQYFEKGLQWPMNKMHGSVQEKNYKQTMQYMSQITELMGENNEVSGLCYIISGFIHFGFGREQKALSIWAKGLKLVPKGQTYDRVKQAFQENPDNRGLLLFIQIIINMIVDDGYKQVSEKFPVIHPEYGVIKDWDYYLAKRIIKMCYRNPNLLIYDTTKDFQDSSNRYLAWAKTSSIQEFDLQSIFVTGLQQKRDGKLMQASETYHSAIALQPEYNAAYFNIAKLYFILGQIDNSIAHYMRCLHLEANNAILRQEAHAQWERSIEEYSQSYVEMMQELNPNSVYLLYDANTLKHLGHAVMHKASIGFARFQDYQQYYQYYIGALKGSGNVVPEEVARYCITVGILFAVENLEWNRLMSVDIYSSYGNSNKYSFNLVRDIE